MLFQVGARCSSASVQRKANRRVRDCMAGRAEIPNYKSPKVAQRAEIPSYGTSGGEMA